MADCFPRSPGPDRPAPSASPGSPAPPATAATPPTRPPTARPPPPGRLGALGEAGGPPPRFAEPPDAIGHLHELDDQDCPVELRLEQSAAGVISRVDGDRLLPEQPRAPPGVVRLD